MEFRKLLSGFLLLVLIVSCIDARKTYGSSSRRSGGSSQSSRRAVVKPRPQQTQQGSQAKKGEDYRNWAAKLTGAGNEQSRPKPVATAGQHGQHAKPGGSDPSKIGWNVPNNKPSVAIPAKPATPDLATKTSATNVQSNYQPSGGYPRQPATNPNYGQSTGNQYNPSSGHVYNPSVGQGQNAPAGGHHPYGAPPVYTPHGSPPGYGSHAAPPAYGSHGSPPGYGSHAASPAYNQPYNPYNPSYGQSYNSHPGASYNPPVGHAPQTILVQQAGGGSGRPGIGQLAKEAFVFAGVSAGVNAAVSRILPGGIYGHSGGGGGGGSSNGAVPAVAGPVSHTQITYNNYYNNGTSAEPGSAAPAAPAAAAVPAQAAAAAAAPAQPAASGAAAPAETSGTAAKSDAPTVAAEPPANPAPANPQDAIAQNNPSPLGFIITDADLKKLSEDMVAKEENNAFKYITMSLQGQKMDDSVTDDASEPLLVVKNEAYELPTIKAVLSLHDNYELDVKSKEVVTPEERNEERELLDKFMETKVMSTAMKFLAEKGYVPDDDFEFKDALRRIWFSQFKRIDGDASSSGFETVFLAEQIEKEIIGLHNWIYFAKQEEAKKANYLGYIKQKTLGDKGAVVKLRSSLNDIVQPVNTIFVGTSPELEFALYTVCFFVRPNNPCPVTIGGTDFLIIANRVNYFGKDILVSAYPEI